MSRPPYFNDKFLKTMKVTNVLQDLPSARLAETLKNLPTAQLANSLQTPEWQHFLESTASLSKGLGSITNSPEWAGLSRAIDVANHALVQPETLSAIQNITQNTRGIALAMNNAILPHASQLSEFVSAASKAVQPLSSQFAAIEIWRSSLVDRIGILDSHWALENHLGISTIGFARIARLHDIATSDHSFTRKGSDVFEEELGEPVSFDEDLDSEEREEAILEAGMNAELIAFPRPAYSDVLISAGFDFSVQTMASIASENGDDSGVIDPHHSGLLGLVENHLRNLVATELQSIAGERWYKTRVPHELYKQWKDKKDTDHEQRRDSYPLIYYSDLMHLSDVICRKDNWEQVFYRFFNTQADIQISFQRLSPVRRAIAHYRPLIRADQIALFSEAYRILSAIGVKL